MQAEARDLPSGDQDVHSTQCLCPLQVNNGLSVFKSQNRTVVSPEPLARCLPSGLKLAEMTASEWPGNELKYGNK